MSTMEEIMAGRTEHKAFAPLSGAQTLELARQLREETRLVQAGLEDLRREFAETAAAVTSLQHGSKDMTAAIHTVQEGIGATNKKLDKTKTELGQTDGKVRSIKAEFDTAAAKLERVLDGQEHMNTRMEALLRDNSDHQKWLTKLQHDLDKNFEGDKSDRGEFEEVAGKLFRGQEQAMKFLEDAKAGQAALEGGLRKVGGDLDKTVVFIQNIEERLNGAGKNLKSMAAELKDTTTKSQQLEEDHDRTKNSLSEVQGNTRKLLTQTDKLEEGLRSTTADLQSAQKQLNGAQAALTIQNGKLQSAEHEVKRLGEGHKSTGNLLRVVQQRLEETHHVAQAVKDGLNQTNSLVLPNIHLDAGVSSMGTMSTMPSPMGARGRSTRGGMSGRNDTMQDPMATPRRTGTAGRADMMGQALLG